MPIHRKKTPRYSPTSLPTKTRRRKQANRRSTKRHSGGGFFRDWGTYGLKSIMSMEHTTNRPTNPAPYRDQFSR